MGPRKKGRETKVNKQNYFSLSLWRNIKWRREALNYSQRDSKFVFPPTSKFSVACEGAGEAI